MESYPGVGVTSIFRLLAILKVTDEDPTYASYAGSLAPSRPPRPNRPPITNTPPTAVPGHAEPLRSSQSNRMPDQRRRAGLTFVVEQEWNRAVG